MITFTAKDKKLCLYTSPKDRKEAEFATGIRARYDRRLGCFTLAPSYINYKMIYEEARRCGIDILVDDRLVAFYEKKLTYKENNEAEYQYKTDPLSYQFKMTNFILGLKKCFVFGGVGVGKSKVSIDAASELMRRGDIKKCLVICPASLMGNFEDEVKKHSFQYVSIIDGTVRDREHIIKSSGIGFYVINYEMINKLEDELIKAKFDMAIIDEIHRCKNHTSVRAKSVYQVCDSIPIRVGLTGTAISNSYHDLFMPFKIVDSSIFGKHISAYRTRYIQYGGFMNRQIFGYNREEELKRLVASISMKVTLRDVVDLPPEVEIVKKIKMNASSLKIYENLKKNLVIEVDQEEVSVVNVLEKLLRLSQMASGFTSMEGELKTIGSEKLDELDNLISEIEGKVAVFCRFTYSIDRIAQLCEKKGYSYMIFDGRTKDKSAYKKFNQDNTKVFITQIQKGIGYSIPSCKYAIFYELSYSRADKEQCKGRNLRAVGSEDGSCFYIFLLCEKTIDDTIFDVLKEKDFTASQALEYVKRIKA